MKEYNVFISYKTQYEDVKTRDSQIAQEIYQHIQSIPGANPFLDTEELYQADGSSDFNDSIFEALASAKIFIYVCTNPYFLRTSYIEGEWTTYLGELNSGRKPKGSIFGIVENIKAEDIPLGLRKFEILTYSSHNMETLKKFVENRLNTLSNGNSPSLGEWKRRKIDEIQAQGPFYSNKNVSLFLKEFLDQEDYRLAYISVDKTYRSGHLLRAEILGLCAEYDVYFFDTVSQAQNVLSNTEIEFEKSSPIIIVNQIYSLEEYNIFRNLLDAYTNCRFVFSAYEGIIHEQPDEALCTIVYAPTNYELDILINAICQDIGYPHSNTLLDQFMLPMYECRHTPELISIVIKQLKRAGGFVDNEYNIFQFYDILDDYLDSKDPNVMDLIYDAVKVCEEKGINRFQKNEVNGSDSSFDFLISHGILDAVRNGYRFACEDYLLYKMADNITSLYGGNSIEYLLNHGLEECLPFCVSIMIQKHNFKPAFDFVQKIQQETIVRLVEFLIVTPNLAQAISEPIVFSAYMKIMYRYIDHGYCRIAKKSIDGLCEYLPEYSKHPEIRQLTMVIDYYLNGVFNDCQNTDSTVYWLYKGLISYYADEYEDAEKAFDQALVMSQDNTSTCHILMNYADLLVDCGKITKLNLLLDRYSHVFSDLQDYENYYIYRGNIALARMNLDDAYDYYKEAYSKILYYYKANTVARICGDLGLVEYYRGNIKEAERYFLKNQSICIDSDNANGIAISRQYLCQLCLMDGRTNDAYGYVAAAHYYAISAHNNWRINQSQFLLDHFLEGFEDRLSLHISAIESIPSPQYHSDCYILLVECMLRSCCKKQKLMNVIEKAEFANQKIKHPLNTEIIRIYKDLLANKEYRCQRELSKYGEYAKRLVDDYSKLKKITVSNKPLPFSKYQELETERLKFLHVSAQHATGIFNFASRQQPTKYVLWERHKSIIDTYAYIDSLKKLETTGEYMIWVLVEKNYNNVIGTIDLNYESNYGGVEFGIILSDFYWNKGYGSEALTRIFDFSRTKLQLDKLFGVCVRGNRRSDQLMIRNGFVYEKTIDNYHDIKGMVDHCGYFYVKKL